MKKIFLMAIFMLSACASQQAIVKDKQVIQGEVMERFDSLVEAVKSLDTQAYFSHFDNKKFTALNENGTVTHSFNGFEKAFLTGTQSVSRYQSLVFQNVKVSVINPTTVILVNEYKASVVLNTGLVVDVAGAGSQVWHKSHEVWQLVSISSSAKNQR